MEKTCSSISCRGLSHGPISTWEPCLATLFFLTTRRTAVRLVEGTLLSVNSGLSDHNVGYQPPTTGNLYRCDATPHPTPFLSEPLSSNLVVNCLYGKPNGASLHVRTIRSAQSTPTTITPYPGPQILIYAHAWCQNRKPTCMRLYCEQGRGI